MRRLAVAALAVLASAAPAVAHGYNAGAMNAAFPATRSYTGAWPVTISDSQFFNGTGCLTLNGNAGGGSASFVFGNQKYGYGSFLVLDGIFVGTIQEPLYGQNGSLMFIADANRGRIGKGVFENVEGGSNFDFGHLVFGTKNGC